MTVNKTKSLDDVYSDGYEASTKAEFKEQQKGVASRFIASPSFTSSFIKLLARLVNRVLRGVVVNTCPREQAGWPCKGSKACIKTHYRK